VNAALIVIDAIVLLSVFALVGLMETLRREIRAERAAAKRADETWASVKAITSNSPPPKTRLSNGSQLVVISDGTRYVYENTEDSVVVWQRQEAEWVVWTRPPTEDGMDVDTWAMLKNGTYDSLMAVHSRDYTSDVFMVDGENRVAP
jgi:hypothetical protein